MKKFLVSTIILMCLISIINEYTFAQKKVPGKHIVYNSLQKTAADSSLSLFNIGNITSWIASNGLRPASIYGGTFNGYFPNLNKYGPGVIYQEGIVWGGIVDDGNSPSVRVGGNTYNSGTTQLTRIVRVRPDYKTADLTNDAASFFLTSADYVTQSQVQQVYDQYAKDWQEWPADQGAPYEDVNHDGIYEPNIDVPGIPGASQTIFISYDDRNSVDVYGSPPVGLQVNETIWGYSMTGPLRDAIFKKVDLIYKGTSTSKADSKIDSMYIVQWADPDIGIAYDDYAGCDSTLNLGYAYNSTPTDQIFYQMQLSTPAVGYVMLQGVSEYTGISSDSAMFNLSWRHGYKYINRKPLSTFIYFASSGQWGDPPLATYDGSLQWYNLMRGYKPVPSYPGSDPFPSPYGSVGGEGTYLLPGDPIEGTGWVDGQIEDAGDRRICNINGPFSLNLGDTAEIVVAEVGGYVNYFTTSANLLSLKNLKVNSYFVTQYFNGKTAAYINAPDIANVDTLVNLSVIYLPSDAQVNSVNWSINKKPAGSNAQISGIQNISASFTPDIAGDYEISFNAIINGSNVTATKQILAIINHIPVADMIADKDTLEWGDSVLVDYSGTSDADGDSLSYKLTGYGFFNIDEVSRTAYFLPDPTVLGNATISLSVNDKYSYDSTAVDIFIKPKLENIGIDFSYVDTAWNRDNLSGFFYFKGSDSLFVPMYNSLRRYEITDTGIQFKEDYANIKCYRIWSIDNNLLYGMVDSAIYFAYAGKLSIFDLSNGGNKLLSGYLPGTSEITAMTKIDGYYYVQDLTNNLYKIDFSNPSSPQIINSVPLDTPAIYNYPSFIGSDANYLYYFYKFYNGGYNYFIRLYDKINLEAAGEIQLPLNTFNTWSVISNNDTIVCYSAKWYGAGDSGVDSIYVYRLNNDLSLALLKKIYKPSLFPNPSPDYYARFYYKWGASFLNNFLGISDYYGGYQKLFDITDLNNIKSVASWYGGKLNFVKQKGNYYLISIDPREINQSDPYSGINKIKLDYVVGVENQQSKNILPLTFALEQNYPNPFNPSTIIRYELPRQSLVTLKIYDILGRELKVLVNEQKPAGKYEVKFDGKSLSSGIYFYRIKAEDFVQTKKMVLLK